MIGLLEEILGGPVVLKELKHKPGRRRTLRARGAGGSAIVKVYDSDRASLVAARVAALGAGPREPVVPTVLHVDPELHLIVLSDVPGRPLSEALLGGDLVTSSRVGVVLSAWHSAWSGIAPSPLQPHTIDRELEILLRRAASASPPVARAVAAAAPRLSGNWTSSTVVHRDLYEEQVLIEERIGLIDVDDAALGPPELDLGNLLAHVELLELRQGRDLAKERRALLDGYAQTGRPLHQALLDRCHSLTLLRLACLNDDIRLAEAALSERAFA
jgi:hypothetical protein